MECNFLLSELLEDNFKNKTNRYLICWKEKEKIANL